MEIQRDTVKTDNFEMKYAKFGKGATPLVVIPGMSMEDVTLSAEAVAGEMACLADKHTIYLFDRKDGCLDGYYVEDMTHDISKALDILGISDAHIFGASQGGMIALLLAIRRKDLVKKLFVASTSSRPNSVTSSTMSNWYEKGIKGDIRNLNRDIFSRSYGRDYYEKYKSVFEALESKGTPERCRRYAHLALATELFDCYDELDKITCPVFVCGAWEDKVLSGTASVEIAQKLSAPLYMYRGYGHSVYDEDERFYEKVKVFFD